MERNILFLVFCLVSLVGAGIVYAQGFTGPGSNPPPPQPGHSVSPLPPPGFGVNPPPPPGGPQGFTGPGSHNTQGQPAMMSKTITISEAKELPHDSWVMLSGNIVNSLPSGNHYTLRDSSGEIAVDIGPKEWRGLSVDVSDRVEIYGEVKIHRGQLSIKVHAITGSGKTNARQGQAVTVDHPITINEAVNLPHDSWVILQGNITSSITVRTTLNPDSGEKLQGKITVRVPEGKHNYSFRDASGEIIVDIGPKEWRGLSVGVSDRIMIYGEVKNHRGQISIKVQAIRILY